MREINYDSWAAFLLAVGDGSMGATVTLPRECFIAENAASLILYTLQNAFNENEFDGNICILAPTNKICHYLNDKITDLMTCENNVTTG